MFCVFGFPGSENLVAEFALLPRVASDDFFFTCVSRHMSGSNEKKVVLTGYLQLKNTVFTQRHFQQEKTILHRETSIMNMVLWGPPKHVQQRTKSQNFHRNASSNQNTSRVRGAGGGSLSSLYIVCMHVLTRVFQDVFFSETFVDLHCSLVILMRRKRGSAWLSGPLFFFCKGARKRRRSRRRRKMKSRVLRQRK